MPRLCILTQYFPPEMGAPQVRLSELGHCLSGLGWDVDVLTALPNYPSGRIYDGFPKFRTQRERLGTLDVLRVPLIPAKAGLLKRLACYLSFAASATVVGPLHLRRPDLLLVESPPLFIGLAAFALGNIWRCPYVFNVSDLWPDSPVQMGLMSPGIAAKVLKELEYFCYANAAGMTGQSGEIVADLRRQMPSKPVELITNGVDPSRFGSEFADAEARALIGDEPGPVFVFAGLFGYAQGLDQLLDLAKRLPADVPGRIVLVGDGPMREALDTRIREERIARVKILPRQPRERVPAIMACADAAVISLGVRLPGAVPSKIYEAMAARLPILLVAEGEPASIVESTGSGRAVVPSDLDGLLHAFRAIATDAELRTAMGANGRRAAETTYFRGAIAERLDAFLRARL